MRGLSNLLGLRDGSGKDPGPLVCRPAVRAEVDPALRLLLIGSGGLGSDAQVMDFIQMTHERGIDLSQLWIAHRNGTIYWTLLPVVSPGKTMLLFTPGHLPRGTTPALVQQLVHHVLNHHRAAGVQLAQFLIDPRDRSIVGVYEQCGFSVLAELLYLQRSLNRPMPRPATPYGLELITYSQQTHPLFAAAIQQSYSQSLDCPALNGLRDIEDVITGHRCTGEFDPNLWFAVLEQGQPIAALLLTRALHTNALELVYLGLIPQARGRSIGDFLMMLALSMVHASGCESLSLAVDSSNHPATKLYYRHGLSKIGSRIAMLKDLRPEEPHGHRA